MYRFLLLLVFFRLGLFGETVDTFYGAVEVEEPVLIELTDSPRPSEVKIHSSVWCGLLYNPSGGI